MCTCTHVCIGTVRMFLAFFFRWRSLFFPDFFCDFVGLQGFRVCMYACAHVFPHYFRPAAPFLPDLSPSSLVTISPDPSCLPNPSPGGVVLVALPSARRTQLTLPPPGFKQRRMLKCMPPLRLLHLTQPRLCLGWLFLLTVVWLANYILLLAPHLAMTLRGESRHRLRRGKGWG